MFKDYGVITRIIQENFRGDAEDILFIGKGMYSQAFSFRSNGEELILRLGRWEKDFLKDAHAYRTWPSPLLPIPEILAIGEIRGTELGDGLYYAVSRRVQGHTLASIQPEEMIALIPSLFGTLDAIRTADVSGSNGWGLLDATGTGPFPSWPDYLRARHNQKLSHDWQALANHSFFDNTLYHKLRNEMEMLLQYAPAEKYLVHGDFGFDNVMADAGGITGVLDWGESQLGDFLYDIAYLDFWPSGISYGELWKEHADRCGYDVPYFEERMRCYMMHIAMESMAIAATRDDEEDYEFVVGLCGRWR